MPGLWCVGGYLVRAMAAKYRAPSDGIGRQGEKTKIGSQTKNELDNGSVRGK